MKKLVGVVREHAQRHRDLLDRQWEQTEWTRAQAEQILRRIDGVLTLLPQAQKQAHERIIGGRPVDNADKIQFVPHGRERLLPSRSGPLLHSRSFVKIVPREDTRPERLIASVAFIGRFCGH
jgi:hypothetical protein